MKVPVVLDGGRVAGGHDGGALPEEGIRIKQGQVKRRGVLRHDVFRGGTGSQQGYVPGCSGERHLHPSGDSVPGSDAVEIMGLRDVVFEYEITSNRVDCYSVIGIAREAAATFGKAFHAPVVTPTGNGEDIHDYLNVRVENSELCPRYCARMVKI